MLTMEQFKKNYMKVIDCIWDLKNLDRKTIEVVVSRDDKYNVAELQKVISDFEYIVVKVPMNMTDFNYGLSTLGFSLVETQMNISKRYKDFPFDDRLVKQVYPKAFLRRIEKQQELDDIIERMTPNMFSTDRIYLDSHFSKGQSCIRYQNWIRSEFEQGASVITEIIYEGKNIGFGMERQTEDGTKYGLLGGIYEEYQSEGLGLMTTSIGFINAHKENKPFKVMRTSISSNNVPVLQFYNYLNFKIDSMTYVFVKHNI